MNTVEQIKELRSRTHLGLTECKKALEEFSGDIEKAIEALQKRGLKKVDDLILPTEGVVRASLIKDDGLPGQVGFIAEVNCQTDFGARSEVFQQFVEEFCGDPSMSNLKSKMDFLSNQLGEKIVIRRTRVFDASPTSIMTVYNHLGGKIAVLMESELTLQNSLELPRDRIILDLLDNVAMQIAANKPLAVSRQSLSSDLVQKKTVFYEDEVKFKPEQVRAKILDGKMSKWYSEVVLLEQEAIFIGDNGPKGQTVQKEIDRLGLNNVVAIKRFVRFERGEAVGVDTTQVAV